jgi:hypothetical protein
MNPLRSLLVRLLLLLAVLTIPARADDIEEAFAKTTGTARPTVYWFWMGHNMTKEGITGDLEALKEEGFGGTTMCNLGDVCDPWPGAIANSPLPALVPYSSDAWWDLIQHAASESHRLGLEFGFHNCPGYESNGGTWITPELSMQEVVYSQTPVTGPDAVFVTLPKPVVDPHAQMSFPVLNEDNGKVEKPIIPGRMTYFKDIAVLAMPAEGAVSKDQIIDLSSQMNGDGVLRWTPPAGKWVIYRFGHTTMGALIQPAPWKATGLECDKMSAEAVEFHMNHVIGEIQKHCPGMIGNGIDFLWFDSYEAGTPTWTPKMREEFSSRRGYDMTPFLGTFANRLIGSPEETGKFKDDFSRTIKDLYRDIDFGVTEKVAHAAGLKIRSEPYGGPWVISEVIPHFDQVAGEFWNSNGKYGPYAVTDVSAGAKLAGQNVVNAEAFTAGPDSSKYTETPEFIKPIGDAAFCDGVNRFMLHRFTEEPFGDKYKPGIVMGQWGTHFDRTQTWWEPGKAWVKYLERCQGLLQWGQRIVENGDFHAAGAGAAQVKFLHRKGPNGDVYFVADLARESRNVNCTFAVTGRQPEWWDPVTGATRDLPDFTFADGKTVIPISFAPAQSGFVVFRKPVEAAPTEHKGNFPGEKTVAEVAGAWKVSFDPKWGGPAEPADFPALVDWTQRPEAGIRYYSGTATYKTTFDVPGNAMDGLSLDLGVVHDLARVRINGKDLGVAWTAPWKVAIPADLLKPTGNELEIEITNCWANRQIGDEQEPPDCEWTPGFMGNGGFLKRFPDWFTNGTPRPSKGRYTFTTWNYFTKDSKLEPSGLIGPVRVVGEDWTQQAPVADSFVATAVSAPGAPILVRAAATAGEMASYENDIAPSLVKVGASSCASVEDTSANSNGDGASNADAIRNGTTLNGSGGAETLDDGKTYRGYGDGNSVTFHLNLEANPGGYDLTEIRSFAGHSDARAGQNYTVSVAYANASGAQTFVKLADGTIDCPGGGSTELRITEAAGGVLDNHAGASGAGVSAVRLDFHNGAAGFDVYREINVIGKPHTGS